MDSILPDSVRKSPHIKVYDLAMADAIENIDLTPVMVYMIDTVPVSVLPFLADQFNVMGIKGWKYALTDFDKRELIKKAIELHRRKGTPWSIKEALKSLGIFNTIVDEHVIPFTYDGSINYNGLQTYSSGFWPMFRVIIDAAYLTVALNQATIDDIVPLIYEYKNVRSHLVDVSFAVNFSESVSPTESETLSLQDGEIFSGDTEAYNGLSNYDGSEQYGGEYDTFEVTIINI